MFKNLWLLACFITAIGAIVFFRLGMPSVLETLDVRVSIVDFGNVRQGAVLDASFDICNRHSTQVELAEILVGCGCAEPKLSKKNLDPGESAVLTVKWRTGSSRNRVSHGIILKYALAANAQKHIIELGITADVDPDINYSPSQVVFPEGEPSNQLVRFAPGRRPDTLLGRAYCTHRAFSASVAANVVAVAFSPSEWRNDSDIIPYLVVETTSPSEPKCRIPILFSRSRESKRSE